MARWAQQKKDQFDSLAQEVLHNYGHGRAVIAIDGGVGAGARPFADDLAATVRVLGHEVHRASLDDFHAPRSAREPDGRCSPTVLYDRGYDYSLLRRVLLDPFRATSGTGFVLAAFDARRDAPFQSKWTTASPDALLIVDGVFMNRAELAGHWNYSVWLETPKRPEPGDVDEQRQCEREADAFYREQTSPRGAAMAIIDNSDPEHPQRIFADSC